MPHGAYFDDYVLKGPESNSTTHKHNKTVIHKSNYCNKQIKLQRSIYNHTQQTIVPCDFNLITG